MFLDDGIGMGKGKKQADRASKSPGIPTESGFYTPSRKVHVDPIVKGQVVRF